jgi:hypothetical protein
MQNLSIVRYALGLNDRDGVLLSSYQEEAATTILATALSTLFGGCTIYKTRGYWESGQEPSLVFEAYGQLSEAEEAAWLDTGAEYGKQLILKQAAQRAAVAANQEAVMLVISSAPGAISFVGQPVLEVKAAR